jgi:CT1975-like protein
VGSRQIKKWERGSGPLPARKQCLGRHAGRALRREQEDQDGKGRQGRPDRSRALEAGRAGPHGDRLPDRRGTRIVTLYGDDPKAIAAELKSLRKNFHAVPIGAGIDAAMFGRFVSGDCDARLDAAVQVAHAFSRSARWGGSRLSGSRTKRNLRALTDLFAAGSTGCMPAAAGRDHPRPGQLREPDPRRAGGRRLERSLRLRLLSFDVRLQPVRGPRVAHAAARQRAQH